MTWTALHGPLLARAFAAVLGEPQTGAIAFARCLTPDVVAQLSADGSFAPKAWQVLRVADVADRTSMRTIAADRAVELREDKGEALLLLVDTEHAGAGMDGIYSAGQEVDEASLFREAQRKAVREIAQPARRYAEDALKTAARGHGGKDAVSPWAKFDFLCQVAAGDRSPGAYLYLLGLWPIRYGQASDHLHALGDARRFTDRLLGPATANLPPTARIQALRLDEESRLQQPHLERFLHAVDAKPLLTALNELTQHEHLWVGALRTEGPAQSLMSIELTSWRNRNGTISRWSGLTDAEGDKEPPELILSKDGDGTDAALEVRWKTEPSDLERNAVDYRVVVLTSLDEELAVQDVPHSVRKGGEKCRFSSDDFATLDEDSLLPAKVVVSAIGRDNNASAGAVEQQESEEFVIRFGEPPDRESGGVGVRVRTFSEGLAEMTSREAVAELAAEPPVSLAAPGEAGWITLRTPVKNGRRKSFRVFRPSLIAEVERNWHAHGGRVGRWVAKGSAAPVSAPALPRSWPWMAAERSGSERPPPAAEWRSGSLTLVAAWPRSMTSAAKSSLRSESTCAHGRRYCRAAQPNSP